MERIGFHARAAAFLVDLLIFGIIAHLAAAFDWLLFEAGDVRVFGVVAASAGWLTLFGFGLLEAMIGTSPGKRLVRVSIARDDASPAPSRALLLRALFKFAPVVLAVGGCFAYAVMMQWSVDGDVRNGFEGIFWADVVVVAGLTVFIIVGCFRAMNPDRQAYHDLAAGTAVFWTAQLRATRGFVPVIATATIAEEPQPAASTTN